MKLQGTPEWFEAKLGKIGASHISDVMAKGSGTTRNNYMMRLLCERLTGNHEETYSNATMKRGIEEEPMAIAEYELATGRLVTAVGFIDNPKVPMSGASPDGLVGDDGLIEVKSPNTAQHVDTLLAGKIDRKYRLQMMWQIYCTKREWCDFVSYDPRMPPKHQLVVIRVEKDNAVITDIRIAVETFLTELDALEAKLK